MNYSHHDVGVVLEFLHEVDQEFRDVGADISTVGTCVLGSEPDLFYSFFDHCVDSFGDSFGVVGEELTSGENCFAVGAGT